MTWVAEHWFVLVLLAAYTGLIARHALAGKRATETATDYYVGGRSMGGIALGLSFFATYSSTNSFVGLAGQSYLLGAPWLLLAPCAVVFSLLAWTVVAPRLRRFTAELDSVTIPDFLGFRFQSPAARLAAALIIVFASFLYMTAVFKGIGNLLEAFLDIRYEAAIGVVFVVVVVYTVLGGFVSVVKTDAVQGLFMIVAGAVLLWGTASAAGGIGVIFEMPDEPQTERLFDWNATIALPVLLGMLIAGSMKLMVEPRQLSRFYALRDQRAVRRGMLVSTGAFLLVYTMLAPIGLYAWRILPAGLTDSDLVVPSLLQDTQVFSSYVGAFLMVAMLAAAMSSLDSVLLVTATTVQRDILSRFGVGTSSSSALRNTRRCVVALALATALIALDPPGQIVTLTTFAGSLFAACFFPAIVLGLHWRRGSGAAVLASILVGVTTLLVWQATPWGALLHRVFPALVLSTTTYILVATSTRVTANPRVEALFQR